MIRSGMILSLEKLMFLKNLRDYFLQASH